VHVGRSLICIHNDDAVWKCLRRAVEDGGYCSLAVSMGTFLKWTALSRLAPNRECRERSGMSAIGNAQEASANCTVGSTEYLTNKYCHPATSAESRQSPAISARPHARTPVCPVCPSRAEVCHVSDADVSKSALLRQAYSAYVVTCTGCTWTPSTVESAPASPS
jgi:hypothetical protein